MSDLLFVDDNPDILEANRSYFEDQGFHATACISGEAAALLLQTHSFDCIVLDVMMPGMDGYEVCKVIREKTSTPVIFLSCLDQPDDKIRGLMLGGDAYMVKPYDLRELHAQVVACVRRKEKEAAPAPDFFIDRERRIVRLHEHSAILSKKEMALLCLLLSRPDKTLSKESLCAALWPGEAADENRLQSLVRNLRRKTDFACSHIGRITSVYGQGYRLDAGEGEGD
ncbi:response regulator transcription factor [Diplocloster agilis]|uniref:response regulator transcription factor n=1 Tax=Diplocloster agilis TaxID=2850323 RepID=UPI000822E0CA|nr:MULTISPECIES: response regulator transcription factor [Lachnospiraceae]MBU9745770.1 response regulator transcription factor [Diplocloster agilis]MCU6735523.1 response regulator transcription factor [Suonthocola fibrivorans]SCJ75932.1 Staphylococcus exoprotein expression protein R [uncultured Clostridium sp.]